MRSWAMNRGQVWHPSGGLGTAWPTSEGAWGVPRGVGTPSSMLHARGSRGDTQQVGEPRPGGEAAVSDGLGVARQASGGPGGVPKVWAGCRAC